MRTEDGVEFVYLPCVDAQEVVPDALCLAVPIAKGGYHLGVEWVFHLLIC
jgi:hypothetical protein